MPGEYVVTSERQRYQLTTERKIKYWLSYRNVPPVINGATDLRAKEGETVSFKTGDK